MELQEEYSKKDVVKILKRFKLKDLDMMESENIVSFPASKHEVGMLAVIHSMWGKKKWLKRQLASMSAQGRWRVLETSKLDKVETYIYSRYVNMPKGKRILISQVVREVCAYFKLPTTVSVVTKLERTVRRVRRLAKRHRDHTKSNQEGISYQKQRT